MMMLTAKPRATPKAATARRRAACRSRSAGIVQLGAATPDPMGSSVRSRGRSFRGAGRTSGSAGPDAGSRSAVRRRQPEQRPSTIPLPDRTVPHSGQLLFAHPAVLTVVSSHRISASTSPGARHRSRDFLPQHRGEALAQPVDGHPGGGLARPQLAGQALVAGVRSSRHEVRLQLVEAPAAVGIVVFLPEPGQAPREHGRRPLPLEDRLGGQAVHRLAAPPLLRLVHVEGEDRLPSAPLLRLLPIPLVGEEVADGGAEEGAEAARFRPEVLEVALLEEAREVGLGEVLRVRGGVSLAPNEAVDGRPVALAEGGERFLRRGGVPGGGLDDDAPVGGFESHRDSRDEEYGPTAFQIPGSRDHQPSATVRP